jgi:hypothetical protein
MFLGLIYIPRCCHLLSLNWNDETGMRYRVQFSWDHDAGMLHAAW